MIDIFNVFRLAFHADLDPLCGPDAHTLGLQLCQGNAAGVKQEGVGIFFCDIALVPEKGSCPLQGDTPGFFFGHVDHLISDIIPHLGTKRKRKNC